MFFSFFVNPDRLTKIKATISLSPPEFRLLPPTSVSSKLSSSTVYFKSSRASRWEDSFLTQECLVMVEVGFPRTTSHLKDSFQSQCGPHN